MTGVPSTYAGVANVAAVAVLLTEFAMLRAPLLRSQVRLYAFQSLVVTGLAVFVAASSGIGALYVLARRCVNRSVIFAFGQGDQEFRRISVNLSLAPKDAVHIGIPPF